MCILSIFQQENMGRSRSRHSSRSHHSSSASVNGVERHKYVFTHNKILLNHACDRVRKLVN